MARLSSKNVKGCRMNLFTQYTQEETKFLLSLTDKKITREGVHPILLCVDTHNLSHFYKKKFNKKEIIKEYEFFIVNSGKIAVVKNGKIVRTLKKDDVFGLLNTFANKEFTLLVLEDNSEVTLFGIGKCEEIKINLLRYFAEQVKDKVII